MTNRQERMVVNLLPHQRFYRYGFKGWFKLLPITRWTSDGFRTIKNEDDSISSVLLSETVLIHPQDRE